MSDEATRIANLTRVLAITRELAATTDLGQLLERIVDAACTVLGCERATIFLYDKETDELYSRVATRAEEIRFPADRGIAGSVAQTRQVINIPDAYRDDRFNPEIDKRTGFRTRNLLTVPLETHEGELVGVLQALNKIDGTFENDQEELAHALGAQAGVALYRQFLLEEYATKQRMARDLEIARQIQQQLFPHANPQVPGYEIAGWNRSADETGGDCYDFIPLDDGRLALMLADATGHGIGAALVIAQCRSLTRAMLSITNDLKLVATSVNRLMLRDLSTDRFVTAFLGILDPVHHRMDYVAAGQGPLLLITGEDYESRTATDLPFAIMDDFNGLPQRYELTPGMIVTLLTDGFFETESPAGEQFGEERVAQFIQARRAMALPDLIADLQQEVERFSGGAAQADDLTAILLRRQS